MEEWFWAYGVVLGCSKMVPDGWRVVLVERWFSVVGRGGFVVVDLICSGGRAEMVVMRRIKGMTKMVKQTTTKGINPAHSLSLSWTSRTKRPLSAFVC